jgi:hypothetical protein
LPKNLYSLFLLIQKVFKIEKFLGRSDYFKKKIAFQIRTRIVEYLTDEGIVVFFFEFAFAFEFEFTFEFEFAFEFEFEFTFEFEFEFTFEFEFEFTFEFAFAFEFEFAF